jgi:hypothetical protein
MWIDRLQPPHVAPCVSGDGDPAVGIESHSIRSGLRPRIRLRPFISAGMDKQTRAFSWHPLVNAVRRDLGEEKGALTSPYRAFSPLVESGRYFFKFGFLRNQLIDCRVESLNLL